MRYHMEKPTIDGKMYGKSYFCDHPLYNSCTLYTMGKKGLAVIQQRFSSDTKTTYWTDLDMGLADLIYLQGGFITFFNSRAEEPDSNGLYPTVTVRQIMWALRMKPLEKERWETVFDRKDI